jgi:nucleotide-binding universal stress UspA family protein
MTAEILVALDGSPRSRAALPVAIALARATGLRLTLLRVLGLPAIAGDTSPVGGGSVVAEAREQIRREAADDLATLAERIGAEAGVAAEPVFVAGVDAAAVVRAHAISRGARVVVLTTRGAGGAPALGRTADRVLRESQVPVLLVPASGEGDAPTPLAAAAIARVMLPLDGTPSADRIIDHVRGLFGPREVAYTLLDVVVTTRGDDVVDVVDVIVDHAAASGADLIAMLARGLTTAGVVRASRVPVLVVPDVASGVSLPHPP